MKIRATLSLVFTLCQALCQVVYYLIEFSTNLRGEDHFCYGVDGADEAPTVEVIGLRLCI